MSRRAPAGFISAFFNPLKNPDAPTIGTATAGNNQMSVVSTAPANVGGSAITSYIATSTKTSDGTLTSASGAASPVVVTGLTNASAYTATVVAVNSYGAGKASAASNSVTPSLAIGSAYGGGFYVGQISTSGDGIADFNLVVGPRSTAQTSTQWSPAFSFCDNLTVGGFSDWYMPSKNELEICYRNLKPNGDPNSSYQGSGTNPNAVPPTGPYSSWVPGITSASDFQYSSVEAFSAVGNGYWSSTQYSARDAWRQPFDSGQQNGMYSYKTITINVRAIRRVAV